MGVLSRCRMCYGMRHLCVSAALYSTALACYPSIASPWQYLAITVAVRGARNLGKATSDALAFRVAKRLHSQKAAALLTRKLAFKFGQLAGKYMFVPLLAIGDEVAFRVIFAAGVIASLASAALHVLAMFVVHS